MTGKLMLFEKQDVLGFMTDFYRDDKGNLYMTREQIGLCLGYTDPSEAIKQIHKRNHELLDDYAIQVKVKKGVQIDHPYGRVQKYTGTGISRGTVILYKEQGIYLIAMKANTDKAMAFQKAVAGILENLRKGYQVWLLEREKGKLTRRTLTDAIKNCVPDSPHKKFMYKNYTDLIYKTLYGMSCKKLKEKLGLDDEANLRDALSAEDVDKVDKLENLIQGLVSAGYTYQEIKDVLAKKYVDVSNKKKSKV